MGAVSKSAGCAKCSSQRGLLGVKRNNHQKDEFVYIKFVQHFNELASLNPLHVWHFYC
jgi:hypothetical protein